MKKIINEDYTLCRISFYFDLFFLPVEADPFLLLPFFLDTIFRNTFKLLMTYLAF